MPLDRRRRSRRRPVALILMVLVIAVVLFFIIGGIAFINTESAPYRRAVNRSFADQGSVVVAQGNQSAIQLRRLMAVLPALRRANLQQTLDSLVAATASQATSATAVASPPPAAGVGPSFEKVFSERAQAVSSLRSALDGLLGLEPQPVTGSASSSPTTTVPGQGSALLPAAKVISDLQGVGATLQRSDATYASLRRTLATSAGNGHLPRSVWVTDPNVWSSGALATLVDQVAASPTLATVHGLTFAAVSINPASVPSPTGTPTPGGVSTVPPTRTLGVSVVLRNDGNVTESGIVVTASASTTSGGSSRSSSRGLTLQPGTSVATDLTPLAVRPGNTYTVTVSASSATAGSNQAGPSTTFNIAVAPNAPPLTTVPPSTTSTTASHR